MPTSSPPTGAITGDNINRRVPRVLTVPLIWRAMIGAVGEFPNEPAITTRGGFRVASNSPQPIDRLPAAGHPFHAQAQGLDQFPHDTARGGMLTDQQDPAVGRERGLGRGGGARGSGSIGTTK